jgi:hypothetical protein
MPGRRDSVVVAPRPAVPRISLLHAQGRSWATIGGLVGQRNLAVTANTCTHVLIDAREVAYASLIAGGSA